MFVYLVQFLTYILSRVYIMQIMVAETLRETITIKTESLHSILIEVNITVNLAPQNRVFMSDMIELPCPITNLFMARREPSNSHP